MHPPKIEMILLADLRPSKGNARLHPPKQVRQLSKAMERFGFSSVLVIDEANSILAGHGRMEAARVLGMSKLPCIRLSGLKPADKRAFALADNKIALNANWDEELLADELKALHALDPDFDLSLTGFPASEIDSLIEGNLPQEAGDPRDDVLPETAGSPLCRPGDIFALGKHRLVCGDATDRSVVATLMNGQRAAMVFTDPPYNTPIKGHVSGLGKTKHREFAMGSGEMTSNEFRSFLRRIFRNLVFYTVNGSIHFICMDWRHMREVLGASEEIYSELKNLIVWAKDNGGMGTFYRSRHELIFAFKNGPEPHHNNFELGQHGRYRTNVWEYKGVNTFKRGRLAELTMHPTVKPVQMIADAIKDVSPRGAIVLDLFGGSGSTLIAAEKSGRRAYLCELDPSYCDCIIRRWEAYTHDEAQRLNP